MSTIRARTATSTAPEAVCGVSLDGKAVDQEPAEAAEAHDGGDRGGGDDLQHRRTDPGQDQREGTRELDVTQDFRAAHTHAHGRITGGWIDPLDAGIGAGQDRRDGQDDQNQTGGRQERDLTAQLGTEPEEGQEQQAQ